MGYNSQITGTIKLEPALTTEQAVALGEKLQEGHWTRSGVEDWTLTEGLDGLMCAWEDSFRCYETQEGLKIILEKLLPEGVVANGLIERSGETNGDVEMWRVRDGKLTTLEAKTVLDQEAFAKLVFKRMGGFVGESLQNVTLFDVKKAVAEAFSEFRDESAEDGDRLCLEEWLDEVKAGGDVDGEDD